MSAPTAKEVCWDICIAGKADRYEPVSLGQGGRSRYNAMHPILDTLVFIE